MYRLRTQSGRHASVLGLLWHLLRLQRHLAYLPLVKPSGLVVALLDWERAWALVVGAYRAQQGQNLRALLLRISAAPIPRRSQASHCKVSIRTQDARTLRLWRRGLGRCRLGFLR